MWRSHITRAFVLVGLTACLLSQAASPATSSQLDSAGIEQLQPPPSQPQYYEAYYLHQGTYPYRENTRYAPEFQGLTHDMEYWFFANNAVDSFLNPYPAIWKIPVTQDLRHVMDFSPPEEASPKWVYKPLLKEGDMAEAGTNHVGDISYFKGKNPNDIGYVLAPIESSKQSHSIALFKSDNLEYVGRADIDYAYSDDKLPKYEYRNASGQRMYRDLGWVAVDPAGYIYTSPDFTTYVYKYQLNWDELPDRSPELTCLGRIRLLDRSGYPLELSHTQGGVFSEHGGLLYMVTGINHKRYGTDGINVFDTETWRRVAQSTIADDQSAFYYHYEAGFDQYEEPEGITIWDLDNKGAPNISGQLHVGILDNEGSNQNDDRVYISHYGVLYSDRLYTFPGAGTFTSPFNTVGEAYAGAWYGAQIRIQAGFYPEALTLSKHVELRAQGGTVTIGPSIATTPLNPLSTTSVQSPLVTRLSDPTSDFLTTNDQLIELLAQSSAANDDRYGMANIRAALQAGEGLVIFFAEPMYEGSFRASWSGGRGPCDPLWYSPNVDPWDDEAASFLFFAPDNSSLVLHIYEGDNYEEANIRFRGPTAVSDMDELGSIGAEELNSFKFEDW